MLQRLIKKIANGSAAKIEERAAVTNRLRPDAPFFAIGDIHGRNDLLEVLLSKIDPANDQRLVFLGDYIDRGLHAAQTVTRLFEMTQAHPDRVICLMGNHERMMLEFVDDPLGRGIHWLRNGGIATLESFGIFGTSTRPEPDAAVAASDALEKVLSPHLLVWLRQLPLCWNSGNIWCVHAAMDPEIAPDAQRPETMLWGQQDFLNRPREDDICIVHGHTTVDDPIHHNSRIAIDTGAYRTNRLTAAFVACDGCKFTST